MVDNNVERQLSLLENEISNLEAQIDGYTDIKEKFVAHLFDELGVMLRTSAAGMEAEFKDVAFSKEDLLQEYVMYMLKFNLPVVERKSKIGYFWLPYVKRVLKNLYINFLKKMAADKNYGVFVDDRDGELPILDSIPDNQFTSEQQIVYDEMLMEVESKLTGKSKEIFQLLTGNDEKFLSTIKDVSVGTVKITKVAVAKYLGMSYAAVNVAFKDIKKVYVEVAYS